MTMDGIGEISHHHHCLLLAANLDGLRSHRGALFRLLSAGLRAQPGAEGGEHGVGVPPQVDVEERADRHDDQPEEREGRQPPQHRPVELVTLELGHVRELVPVLRRQLEGRRHRQHGLVEIDQHAVCHGVVRDSVRVLQSQE